MAITISGENNNDRILASDGVIDQISGFNIVGVITATTFTGNLIGNVTGNLTGNVNNTSPLLLQTGGYERLRLTGNNEIGIAGANYGSAGQVLTSGGPGSAVSWTTISGTTINNNADNRIITGSGSANTLNGESTLTYDGTNLDLPDDKKIRIGTGQDLNVYHQSSDNNSYVKLDNGTLVIHQSGAANGIIIKNQGGTDLWMTRSGNIEPGFNNFFSIGDTGKQVKHIYVKNLYLGDDIIHNGDDNTKIRFPAADTIQFETSGSSRLRIDSDGDVLVGGHTAPLTTYQSSQTRLSIHKSSGSGAYLELGGAQNTNGTSAGTILFVNDNNADGANNDADGKILAMQRVEIVTSDSNAGDDSGGDLVFMTKPDGGTLDQGLRITSDGKVLVGNSAVTPSRHLDVRGTGHQQILLGSTNNAGASLMVDGQGGGDGSGGLYCTFEAASDGHLKIRNYDPAKSIIFGTGSNTGSNDSVTIDSDGDLLIGTTTGTSDFHLTRTSGAVLHTIEATAAGGEALYKCLGKSSGNDAREVQFRYDSGADAHRIITANNIPIQLCTQNAPRLNIQGDGEVHLPTAGYKFTENNFLSTSAATVNDATAQFTNAMTSMQGSYHSSNNSNGIMDFTDYKASDWNILDVYGRVNPNRGGSGAYSDPFFMTIYKGVGYTYPNVVTVIFAVMHTPAARTFYSSGTGSSGNDGITAVWYNGSSESREFTYSNSNNAANYLRIKVPTSSFNTTHGHGFTARIFKRF